VTGEGIEKLKFAMADEVGRVRRDSVVLTEAESV